jgi:hypothetical protein
MFWQGRLSEAVVNHHCDAKIAESLESWRLSEAEAQMDMFYEDKNEYPMQSRYSKFPSGATARVKSIARIGPFSKVKSRTIIRLK